LNFFNDLSSKKELYLLFIKRAEPINNHFLMFMKIYLEVVFFVILFYYFEPINNHFLMFMKIYLEVVFFVILFYYFCVG